MINCRLEITPEKELVIRVNLNEEHGYTRGYRSRRISTSEGNIGLWLDGEPSKIKFNINVFRALEDDEKAEVRKMRF